MNKPFLVFQAPVATRSGYGDHSKDLVLSLIKSNKYDIVIVGTRWGSCPLNNLNTENADDMLIVERLLVTNELPKQPDIYIQVTVPNEFRPVGKFNIGITAGIETTTADASWVEGCNRMDLIIVPSKHSKDTLINSVYQQMDKDTKQVVGNLKINKPIEVLFEGVNLEIFKKTDELPKTIVDTLNEIPESFAYLFVGHWLSGDLGQDRKDVGMLIRVFLESFKDTQSAPALVLKTSGATFSILDLYELEQKIRMIRDSVSANSLPNIYVLHGDLDPVEINGLYNHPKIKAMVSFTKGEGYGRPLLEFTTSGKPVIVSNWSGQVDFISPKHNILLPGELTEVHKSAVWKGVINAGTKWFTVNYSYAAGVLKDVFRNYKVYSERAKGTIHNTKTNWSLEKMGTDFISLLDSYVKEKPTPVEFKVPTKMELPQLKRV